MTRQAKAQEKRACRAVRRCLSAARDPRDRVLRGLSLVWPWMLTAQLPPSGAGCALLSLALGSVLGATRPALEPEAWEAGGVLERFRAKATA